MTVHTTRLRTLPCSATSLLVLASGLFVTPVSVAGQTDYSAITGRVVNVETMAPIPNVLVASSRVRTVTDATGAFRLRLPAGSHLITVRGLGYGEVTRTIDLAGDTVVQFHLRPDPVVLEGLTVVVQTLERQWQRYGQRGLYLRQADLLDYFTAAEAVRARTRRLPARQTWTSITAQTFTPSRCSVGPPWPRPGRGEGQHEEHPPPRGQHGAGEG
jgi:hypothetical protein